MNNHALDADIPLLTDIIQTIVVLPDKLTEATATIPAAHSAAEKHLHVQLAQQQQLQLQLQQQQLQQQKILEQLQERIDLVIEQRVRESVLQVLQSMVPLITDHIKAGLHHALSEASSGRMTLPPNGDAIDFQKTKLSE